MPNGGRVGRTRNAGARQSSPSRSPAVPVQRHGAGAGGRWLALARDPADDRRRGARRLVEPRSGERPEQGAPQPRFRCARRLRGVRQRLDRRHRARLDTLARVRRRHLRALPRRARRRAVHGSVRRPDAAAARRPPDGARPDGDLPARPGGRPPAGRLGRARDRRARRDADLASLRLPRARALQVPLRDLGRRAPAPAVGAGPRPPRQRRQALDQGRADAVPAGRAGEDLPDHLPRRLPPRQARGARPGPAEGSRAAAR